MSHEVLAQRRQLFISFQIKMKYEKDIFQSVKRAGRKKNPSSPNRSGTYDVLVTRLTTPDALPLSYRRLVGAKATKLRHVTNILHTATTGMSICAYAQ